MQKDLLLKLERTITWARTAPFYETAYLKSGATKSISSLSDFQKVPVMMASDLRNYAHEFSFVNRNEVYSLYATGGTTGKPKLIYYTEEALEAVALSTSEGLKRIFPDLNGEFSILIVPADNLAAVGEYTKRALRNLGSYSGSMGLTYTPTQSAQLARVMLEGKPKLVIGNPARLTKLVRELKESNVDPEDVGLKYILSTSEVLAEKTRKMLQETFGAKVYQGGGMSEVGWSTMEDLGGNGQRVLTNVFAEVLDSQGNSVVDGVGELYLTTLVNPAYPLVRYKTEDLVRIREEKIWYLCRISENINIHEKKVFAYEIDEALEKIPDVTAVFSCVSDGTNVAIKIESNNDTAEIRETVKKALMYILPNVQVELVQPESLERSPRGKVKDRMIQK